MDLLTLQKFEELVGHEGEPSLSLYMPAVKVGREVQQNSVRLKNLMTEADSRLAEDGMGRSEREEFLAPLRELVSVREYWQNQEKGLAIFLGEEIFESYRLPLVFPERVVLNRRFHIKPLLPLFLENERFYLLALSRKDLRLFIGTRYDLAELELPDETPTSLEEALQYDDPERELQYQAGATGSPGDGVIYHGHDPQNNQESNLKRYFQLVDQGLVSAIGDHSNPLILVGLDHVQPIYRQVNSYSGLLEEGVTINPDEAALDSLHQKAWDLLQKRIAGQRDLVLDRYFELDSSRTVEKLEEIIPAAYHSRIDTLFIDLEQTAWGEYDREANQVQLADREDPDSRDLIDRAVIHTLLNGGSVQMLRTGDLEDQARSGAAAILRY